MIGSAVLPGAPTKGAVGLGSSVMMGMCGANTPLTAFSSCAPRLRLLTQLAALPAAQFGLVSSNLGVRSVPRTHQSPGVQTRPTWLVPSGLQKSLARLAMFLRRSVSACSNWVVDCAASDAMDATERPLLFEAIGLPLISWTRPSIPVGGMLTPVPLEPLVEEGAELGESILSTPSGLIPFLATS